jgi:hypothetical protein
MQFPILQYIDVVIGLAVAMIVVATFVTAVTQFIMSATYARARYLRDGLTSLLTQLDPEKLGDDARYVAELVLRDETVGSKKLIPLLTNARNFFTRSKWLVVTSEWLRTHILRQPARQTGTGPSPKILPAVSPAGVLQREELVLLLLQFMSQASTMGDKDADAKTKAFQHLLNVVKGSGTFDVGEQLKEIQKEILNQEAANPKAAAATWRSAAVQAVAQKTAELHEFVAKVNIWYDNTMDRVSANFGLEAKIMTAVVAVVACSWLQLDTIGLVKRLSTDASYRAAVISQAKDLGVVSRDPHSTAGSDPSASEQAKPELCGGLQLKECREQVVNRLAEVRGLSLLPDRPGIILEAVNWDIFGLGSIKLPLVKLVNPGNWPWPGLLLSWVLVSLGAPFWYDVLKNAMGLRSSLAQQDDKDRQVRRDDQTGS